MKRFIETDIWSDPWFMQLPAKEKLLWIHLTTECDPSGVWNNNKPLAEFKLGCKYDWDKALKHFTGRVEVLPNEKWLIKGFVKFQYGKLSPDCKPHAKVFAALDRNGLQVIQDNKVSGRVSDRVLNTLQEEDKEEDKEEDGESAERGNEPPPIPPPPTVPEFIFPPWSTPDFEQRFVKWMEIRRAQGKKPKDWHAMFQEQLVWLTDFGEKASVEILSNSIRNNYQGLFEQKNANGHNNRKPTEAARDEAKTGFGPASTPALKRLNARSIIVRFIASPSFRKTRRSRFPEKASPSPC